MNYFDENKGTTGTLCGSPFKIDNEKISSAKIIIIHDSR